MLQYRIPRWNSSQTQTSFGYNLVLRCLIILKCCTEHGNDAAMLNVKFRNDRATEIDRMRFLKITERNEFRSSYSETMYDNPFYKLLKITYRKLV